MVGGALVDELLELLAESDLPDEVGDLVLAAVEGKASLESLLSGGPSGSSRAQARAVSRGETPSAPELATDEPVAAAYIEEIAIEGFRGVGPRARLQFEPAPGLTLVVGRNGSGKSSFAEALEMLLTGTLLRWADRTRVWQEGWRNLHFDATTEISATFRLDGEREGLVVSRSWRAGEDIDASWPPLVRGARRDWEQLGWGSALDRFRPLLSYSELSTMFSSRAAALYEALSAVLGLESLDGARRILRDARLERDRRRRNEKETRSALLADLRECGDERASRVATLLVRRRPDIAAVLDAAGGRSGAHADALVPLATLELPSPEELVERLAEIESLQERIDTLSAGGSQRLDALAELLEAALSFQSAHGAPPPSDCPVCGAPARIDDSWQLRTRQQLDSLRERSRDIRDARCQREEAIAALHESLSSGTAGALAAGRSAGLDTARASAAWEAWRRLLGAGHDVGLPAEAADAAVELLDALEGVRDAARNEAARRREAWSPLQERVHRWVGLASEVQRDEERIRRLRVAERWLDGALSTLRRARLAPVVGEARANWSLLRHESSIALGEIELRKQGMQRYAAFDVTLEGASASAFGVMSQGELSALAISVFLPRAMLPGTPFAFVVIDDPVQSMDPAKVDGLARVLGRAAGKRQVIVFTHDERLPEAVRRLDIPSRIMRVQRRARSKVEIVASAPPSERYIQEAEAIARDGELSADIAARVVPGFCRSAIEAACAARILRRELAAGRPYVEVEERLGSLTTLHTWLAEAFGLSSAQGQEVNQRVRNLCGDGAVQLLRIVRAGAHGPVTIDPLELVRSTRRLVDALQDGRRPAG